jgi:hypothetical protein
MCSYHYLSLFVIELCWVVLSNDFNEKEKRVEEVWAEAQFTA